MELELITRWKISHQRTENMELCEGLEIKYYQRDYSRIENPSYGIVKKDNEGFFIEWEDCHSDTRIDGSEESKEILKYCGYGTK